MTDLKTLATVLALALVPASMAQADLTQGEIAAIDGQSGIRVFSRDGQLLGITNGVSVRSERTKLFLLARGQVFRGKGSDVNITTFTDRLSLRDGAIVVDEDADRIRLRARRNTSDRGSPTSVVLLGRR